MMPHIVWALASVAIAGIAFAAFWKWLQRERDADAAMRRELLELRKEGTTRDSDFAQAFANLEKGYLKDYEDVRLRVNAVTPNINPLGSSYYTTLSRPVRTGPS